MSDPLLEMRGVSKSFGATRALTDVSLSLAAGEVRALIGENGAGKSTLMKVLAGVHRPDAGMMAVAGYNYSPSGPASARDAGVAMIHQELSLAPHLSIEANILLGQEHSWFGWLRAGEQRRRARAALARLGQEHLPLEMPAGRLPVAKQQMVEIARALATRARVIVFDEPTSSLTEADTGHLFEVISQLRAEGLGIVYISHFLEELAQVADQFTVLRDGCVVRQGAMDDVSLDDIIRWMVGRELAELFPRVPHEPGEPLLRIRGLTGSPFPVDVDLEVRRGEILGLAGLVGAGRSELLRTTFGIDTIQAGSISLAAQGWPIELGRSARHSIRHRLGLLSENRKEEGLALELSIADNLTLSQLGPYAPFGWINLAARRRRVVEHLSAIQCRARSPEQAVGQLSGGNQQKVAIARLLHQDADVFLLDEPTRGIDVGTKSEIYRLMGQLAANGSAVVMVSSYLPELMNVCDRIGVLCRGRLQGVRATADWTEEEIMHCATGRLNENAA